MQHNLLSVLRFSAGLLLLMLGIIGLIIPILHSAVLVLIALPLLSPHHGKQMAEWLKGRFTSFKR